MCVRVCVYVCRISHLEGVGYSQSNDAWTQSASPHHRKNGSSQDHNITNKLQIDCQPPVDATGNLTKSQETIERKKKKTLE